LARILIVDTQIELRHQLIRLLEQAGHSVTAVATISEATSILEERVPDLLATNVVLTDGSSASLAKQAEAGGAKTLDNR
jgi:DNA-binding response OmpR family regulator